MAKKYRTPYDRFRPKRYKGLMTTSRFLDGEVIVGKIIELGDDYLVSQNKKGEDIIMFKSGLQLVTQYIPPRKEEKKKEKRGFVIKKNS